MHRLVHVGPYSQWRWPFVASSTNPPSSTTTLPPKAVANISSFCNIVNMDGFHDTSVATTAPPPVGHLDLDASVFPAEIYERIIDFLADETIFDEYPPNPHPLASCCLTSRSWFPRSRFHLYFEVTLDSRSRLEGFARCLETNPKNSVFVRKLSIMPSEDQGWVSAVPLTLAPKLKHLSMLELDNVVWASLHPNFPQHLAILSTVSQLELYGANFRGLLLMRIILVFPRLQKLLISTSGHSQPSDDEAATLAMARRKGPFPLRHLSLRENLAPILLPALVVPATPLTTLDFLIAAGAPTLDNERGLQSLGLFLSSCGTLRVLQLLPYGLRAHVVCSHLSFSSLSKLHHLRLRAHIEEVEDIAAVAGLLSTISARPLQLLKLELDTSRRPEIMNTSAPWEVLNESFLRPNIRLTGEIATSIWIYYERYAPEEEVFRLLPALKSVNAIHHWSCQPFEEIWDKL